MRKLFILGIAILTALSVAGCAGKGKIPLFGKGKAPIHTRG
jgi:predicted small lipoprotein YifL